MSHNLFMRRALQLARLGEGLVAPNPMVGAVVVAQGRIIGEGYHHRYGGPHAEVNALASVRPEDEHLLREATVYVTLEPCSHYGKTPPCAKLLVEKGVRKVVVGVRDPFPQVSGRGIDILRQAGVEVEEGVMEEECAFLNRRFLTAHREGRPWVLLKWAEWADGGMEGRISTPVSLVWMHRQRALADAIFVGANTLRKDNPTLTTRLYPGPSPLPGTFAPQPQETQQEATILQGAHFELKPHAPLRPQLEVLYREKGITSIMVEGGRKTLEAFQSEGLCDEIRREVAGGWRLR